jgi:hypothetical protein
MDECKPLDDGDMRNAVNIDIADLEDTAVAAVREIRAGLRTEVAERSAGRGLHSSIFQLKLSCF